MPRPANAKIRCPHCGRTLILEDDDIGSLQCTYGGRVDFAYRVSCTCPFCGKSITELYDL